MATLQVKNLPDDLHAALAERARTQGVTMSEYVTRLLRRDLAGPSIEDWIAGARGAGLGAVRVIDVGRAVDAVRVEYEGGHGGVAGGGDLRGGGAARGAEGSAAERGAVGQAARNSA